eukprot:1438201-Rhodomonas_salina.1
MHRLIEAVRAERLAHSAVQARGRRGASVETPLIADASCLLFVPRLALTRTCDKTRSRCGVVRRHRARADAPAKNRAVPSIVLT